MIEKSWPKPITDLPLNARMEVFTLTHTGKFSLMELAFSNYKIAETHKQKLVCLYSFFDHAYHLKDWVKKFSGLKNFDGIWKVYSENIYYKLTRDLCNRSKHFYITQGKESISNKIGLGNLCYPENGALKYELIVRFDNEYIPADILMSGTIEFWKAFFRHVGISF